MFLPQGHTHRHTSPHCKHIFQFLCYLFTNLKPVECDPLISCSLCSVVFRISRPPHDIRQPRPSARVVRHHLQMNETPVLWLQGELGQFQRAQDWRRYAAVSSRCSCHPAKQSFVQPYSPRSPSMFHLWCAQEFSREAELVPVVPSHSLDWNV